MRSKLLKKASTVQELAREHNAILVGEEDVTLNDDLVHLVVIVSEKGNIPGIMIKDLNSESSTGVVIEREFCEKFIETVRDAFIQVRVLEQKLTS
jgi:translation initiation factor RLI1